MVLKHDTSSECALQMYEVSLKLFLNVFKLKRGQDFVTDRQTDRQTDRGTDRCKGKNNMSPTLPGKGGGRGRDIIW